MFLIPVHEYVFTSATKAFFSAIRNERESFVLNLSLTKLDKEVR